MTQQHTVVCSTRNILLAILLLGRLHAFSVGSVGCDDPISLLNAINTRLGENAPSTTVRIARILGDWQLVELDMTYTRNPIGIDLTALSEFRALEMLCVPHRYNIRPRPTISGLKSVLSLPALRVLHIDADDLLDAFDLRIVQFNNIESLVLSGEAVSSESVLKRLGAFPRLKSLVVNSQVSDEAFSDLSNWPSLENASFQSENITDKGLARICTVTTLTKLDVLRSTLISPNGIGSLPRLTGLTSLVVYRIDDNCLSALSNLKHLNALSCGLDSARVDLRGLTSVTELDLAAIDSDIRQNEVIAILPSNVTSLKYVCDIAPEFDASAPPPLTSVIVLDDDDHRLGSLAWLAAFPTLEHLTIHASGYFDTAILGRLKGLSSLWLDCEMGGCADDALDALQHLHRIKAIRCYSPEVTEDGIAHLTALDGIECLTLDTPNVKTPGFESILELLHLRALRLKLGGQFHENVDTVFQRITKLENLEEIAIPGRVSDAGLRELCSLMKLRQLDLRGCYGYTDSGLAYLMSELTCLEEVVR